MNLDGQKKEALSQTKLKELLDYDPATGMFTWRVARQRVRIGDRAGCVDITSGYWKIWVDGTPYRAHRLAWLAVYGRFPTGGIDHKYGIKTDNRIANLRESNQSKNLANQKLRITSTSGFKGVYWNKNCNKYTAQIRFRGKVTYLGIYNTAREAALAYDRCARRLFREFACTNRMLGLLDRKPTAPASLSNLCTGPHTHKLLD